MLEAEYGTKQPRRTGGVKGSPDPESWSRRHVNQPLGREGLFDEVVGALAHGVDCRGDVTVTRGMRKQRQAVRPGQVDIADDDRRNVGDNVRCRRFRVGEWLDLETRKLQCLL